MDSNFTACVHHLSGGLHVLCLLLEAANILTCYISLIKCFTIAVLFLLLLFFSFFCKFETFLLKSDWL